MNKDEARIQLPDGRIAYDAVKLAGLETEGVWLKDCPNHIIVVRTKNTKYTLICESGKIVGTGVGKDGTFSKYLPPNTELRVNGSTFGGSMLKVGYLGVDMHMEFVALGKRITTSAVESLIVVEQNKDA